MPFLSNFIFQIFLVSTFDLWCGSDNILNNYKAEHRDKWFSSLPHLHHLYSPCFTSPLFSNFYHVTVMFSNFYFILSCDHINKIKMENAGIAVISRTLNLSSSRCGDWLVETSPSGSLIIYNAHPQSAWMSQYCSSCTCTRANQSKGKGKNIHYHLVVMFKKTHKPCIVWTLSWSTQGMSTREDEQIFSMGRSNICTALLQSKALEFSISEFCRTEICS